MATNFTQPDENTCVPASFAYLLYKTTHADFEKTLKLLVPACYKDYDLAKVGMEYDQMKLVADKFDIPCEFTTSKPPVKIYLAGVVKLPAIQFTPTDLTNTAIREGALKIEGNYFVYPFAHSVAVFENEDGTCDIFDSYLGKERTITLEELTNDLQKPISYLYLK